MRNLIVCCDGTNNQFGTENTNVVRLVQVATSHPSSQFVYYDPGVGTLPLPGFVSRVGQRFSEIVGLAFGAGLLDKVGNAYRFLMDIYEPGDRVFLFGFSRGAYTVRVLAGLLHMYGLLPRGSDNLLPYILKQFAAARGKLETDEKAFWFLVDEFRRTFARDIGSKSSRRFEVNFIGVWDTVSSVGWAWEPQVFPYTAANPSVSAIRHAIAIDERRAFFRQNRFKKDVKGQDLVELWFPGVHADVGGGYPETEGGLWREPFNWMLGEAMAFGLNVDEQALKRVLNRVPIPKRPWAEPQHESLTWRWWPAEFFPKMRWDESRGRTRPRLGLGRRRSIPADAQLHESVLRRVRDARPHYLPSNPNFTEELSAARKNKYAEANMHREDFGDWGSGLDQTSFWRAVAVLGLIGGTQEEPPASDIDLWALAQSIFDTLPVPAEAATSLGVPWAVYQSWMVAAREGHLLSAEALAWMWNKLPYSSDQPLRIQTFLLWDNDAEIGAALFANAGFSLYHPTGMKPPGADWQWPLRFTFPADEPHRALRQKFDGLAEDHHTMRQLTRSRVFGEAPVAEFMVVVGGLAQALDQLEASPAPLRTHVVLLIETPMIEPDAESFTMIERLQSLAMAKAVVACSVGPADFPGWIYEFVRELAHNEPLDFALHRLAWLSPVVLFAAPELFGMALMRRFAQRVGQTFDAAGATEVFLSQEDAKPIGLNGGVFGAREVGMALNYTLKNSDAFDMESRAATWTTQLLKAAIASRALDVAYGVKREQEDFAEQDARRAQVSVLRQGEKVRQFVASLEHRIEFFIGAKGDQLQGPCFPDEFLLYEASGHLLTVTLTAPGILEQPVLQTVFLPRQGESSHCYFDVTPRAQSKMFDARMNIAYRNRSLQTLRLRGSIVSSVYEEGESLTLNPEMATQIGWGGLEGQQAYDATLTINRLGGEKIGTLQAGYQVLGFSIEGLEDATTKIESRLDASQWDAPGMQGLAGKECRELLQFLAFHGSGLWSTVERYAKPNPAGALLLDRLRNAKVVQVLSANLGARLPIEFFYSGIRPSSKSIICPFHEQRVDSQNCSQCQYQDRDHFCPAGLWSLHRSIEWHQFDESNQRLGQFAPRQFALEEAAMDNEHRARLRPLTDVVMAYSQKTTRVDPDCVDQLIVRIENLDVSVHVAAHWDEVDDKLAEFSPGLLLLLPHVMNGNLDQLCLEIGGALRDESDIEQMNLATPKGQPGPIVLLLGCNTDNAGLPYNSFPVRFSEQASIVVSTISYLLGRHAAPLAGEIVAALVEGQRQGDCRFSEAMQSMRRKALREDVPPVALALKCFGDARWWL